MTQNGGRRFAETAVRQTKDLDHACAVRLSLGSGTFAANARRGLVRMLSTHRGRDSFPCAMFFLFLRAPEW